MPLRRNRRQYEQLTDFDRGPYNRPQRSRHPVPSRETIRRRLTEVGLRSRRPLRRLPLTPHHRQCRLDFCRPRATWSVTDWRRVIFSDESRFSLSADDHRTRVWRRTGQRSDPAFIVELTAISQEYKYTAGQLLRTDNTIINSNHKMKGSKMWKIRISAGYYRRQGGGRVRCTTPAEDRYIVLSAKRNRRTTAQQVANQFLAASGKQISRKTVARRLRGGRLYARKPVVCVPLIRQHRTARLQWCREHHNWTEQDWPCVLFSDESRFSLSSDCRRQLIWRESGTAYRPENIQEKDRYPTCSIMVWAGIIINGRTRLHVVANGTMTGQRYIDEVLLPHVRLFRGAVGDKFVFMDDNATCH
ncbi:transposable element Tcb1 transposase [Trichonephila clavipes]|nr:transposable element Tcb1 transposase [Trichonephila clavipes]